MYVQAIRRYSAPARRYTSYPTAPHFSTKVGELQYVLAIARSRRA